MGLLSQILNKRILSRCNCQIVGKVKNVYFDNDFKKIAYFVIENCNEDVFCSSILLLPFDEVKSFGDVLIVSDCVPLLALGDVDESQYIKDVLSKEVFLQNGISKGSVSDVQFSKLGKVSALVCDSVSFLPSSIWQIGDVILLKGDISKSKSRKLPRPQQEKIVQLLDNDAPASASFQSVSHQNAMDVRIAPNPLNLGVEINAKSPIAFCADQKEPVFSEGALLQLAGSDVNLTNDEHTPTRIICEYDFLLNRTLTKDMTTYHGEPIASKGDVVDDDLVEKCRRHGKLVELTLNSQKMTAKQF